jgi:chromosome segregation protein
LSQCGATSEEWAKQAEELRITIQLLRAKMESTQSDDDALAQEEKLLRREKEKCGGDVARLETKRESFAATHSDATAKLFTEHQLTFRQAREGGFAVKNLPAAQLENARLRQEIRALGNINVEAIDEYAQLWERLEFMEKQLADSEKSKDELTRRIARLTATMRERFAASFARVNEAFARSFRALFDGGEAKLILDDPRDVLECAIQIQVRPPGKTVQNLNLLSGGEKGLASIALLFAILDVNPAPFCVFDEVEAALDDLNVARFARYIKKRMAEYAPPKPGETAVATQFILITHRRGTMDEADVLYGVTMQEEGVSKVLQLEARALAAELGIA